MDIGGRIFELRKKMNINQADFGEKIGVTRSAICNYENGSRSVGEQTIIAICKVYGVNDKWLRTGEGEMFIDTFGQEELSGFMADIFNDDTDFRRRFISILAKLTPSEWALIESMARKLAESEKNTAPEGAAPEDAMDQ